MKKEMRIMIVLLACVGSLWILGNASAFASTKLIKMTEPSLVKPVHLRVRYLYDTDYGYHNGLEHRMTFRYLTWKNKISKRYASRVFYVYRKAIFRQGGKKSVYYYVADKDKVFNGWVHRSKVKKAKSVGYMKELKKVYNIVRNNATTWSFKRAKLILGDTSPSYPYGAKRYSHNLGGGYGLLPDVGISNVSDIVPQLAYGMQKNHSLGYAEPPFDTDATLKNGKTMLLLYRYYQKRKPNFKILSADEFETGISNPATLIRRETETGFETGNIAFSFTEELRGRIHALNFEYNG
ncbi:hypothetical protein [Levilactobacillus suantsaiihabitans]|uniref:Uncharacterized protein n=1 Tax=Levilactobacillus suantsaiihabitans TaxID=2487722 RepID=A0A4Z0J702_9LACO|nr:hypothetical protein [Levilactobacillus suantsaiihabitans]TGD17562.1 hypothetical protein EGT51_11895 [Levilactobacillus suantsaiihabitans]